MAQKHDMRTHKQNLFTKKWKTRCTCDQSFEGDTENEALGKFTDHVENEYWKEQNNGDKRKLP